MATRGKAQVVDGTELVLYLGDEPVLHHGVTSLDDTAWMTPKLTPAPTGASRPEAAPGERSRALGNTADLHHLHRRQNDPGVAKAREAGRLRDVGTGHDLTISEPKVVADMLLRVADI
ncbi:hypothetical protein [Streptomyces canus]|uniref:hypothetical protein n=1 Tax=Streptomyces canus TaxID=58343 RepID=UPI0036E0EE55